MADKLYVAWQDSNTRAWHTIGRLSRIREGYEFIFTRGVELLSKIPEELFQMNVRKKYLSDDLTALFKNKLPSRNRSDFARMAKWLNLSGGEEDFELLSKFGMIPGGDSILIYPEPLLIKGQYHLEFFVHGMRHMQGDIVSACTQISEGSKLLPLLDLQNPVDHHAVALRGSSSSLLLGYVPAFYAPDVSRILLDPKGAESCRISVLRNNSDAPIQLRLLCRLECEVSSGFRTLDTDAHQPLLAAA